MKARSGHLPLVRADTTWAALVAEDEAATDAKADACAKELRVILSTACCTAVETDAKAVACIPHMALGTSRLCCVIAGMQFHPSQLAWVSFEVMLPMLCLDLLEAHTA